MEVLEGGHGVVWEEERAKSQGSVVFHFLGIRSASQFMGRFPQSVCQWYLRASSMPASKAVEHVGTEWAFWF